jgi:hypothetical protein
MDEEVLDSSVWKKTNTTIDEFILWRKDNAPEKDDPRHQVLEDWIDLSKAVLF